MTGSFSLTDSQPTGGDEGGEIRNCLSGLGGSRKGDDEEGSLITGI